MFSTHYFSTAKMVTRGHLIITLYVDGLPFLYILWDWGEAEFF